MQLQNIRFAGQRLIEAYGNFGFRVSDGSFDSSILILPQGVTPFKASQPADLHRELFAPVFDCPTDIDILLLGTGDTQHFPPRDLIKIFIEHNIALEAMDTGAACRTYNVLVSEERRVAAALMAL